MNSRFTMAAHMLAMLAHSEQAGRGPVTSARFAESIQTNPVVVRRVLSDLTHAGLVVAKCGVGGGVTLAKKPSNITLLDVFSAVEGGDELFGRHPAGPNPDCMIGPHIAEYLAGISRRAMSALEESLRAVTLAEMFQELLDRVETGTVCPEKRP